MTRRGAEVGELSPRSRGAQSASHPLPHPLPHPHGESTQAQAGGPSVPALLSPTQPHGGPTVAPQSAAAAWRHS